MSGFVTDGHHKLAAYANLGLAARCVVLCDLSPRVWSCVLRDDEARAAFDAAFPIAG